MAKHSVLTDSASPVRKPIEPVTYLQTIPTPRPFPLATGGKSFPRTRPAASSGTIDQCFFPVFGGQKNHMASERKWPSVADGGTNSRFDYVTPFL